MILVLSFVAVPTVIVVVAVVLALPAVTVFMVGVTVPGRGLVLVGCVFGCLFRRWGALAGRIVASLFGRVSGRSSSAICF
ncbi:hypothetical protein ACOZ4I_10270 [Haloarcula salina]|uniref:hypothetical protein n=1 Tax=Haloarcula salina TaxID=1429914 RepID=UPI003C6FF90B